MRKVLSIIDYVKARQAEPFFFTLEQPLSGKLKDQAFVKELLEGKLGGRRTEVSFCKFGEQVQKNTLVWTNSPTVYQDFMGGRWKCTKSWPCALTACGCTHKNVRGRSLEAMPFPDELCHRWVKDIERDIHHRG